MVSPCFVVKHHKMSIDIGGMRKPYYDEQHCFEIKDLTGIEPLAQFKAWFDEASSNSHIGEFSYLFHLYLLRLRFTIREAPDIRPVLLSGCGRMDIRLSKRLDIRKIRKPGLKN